MSSSDFFITATDHDELINKVNGAISDGWRCLIIYSISGNVLGNEFGSFITNLSSLRSLRFSDVGDLLAGTFSNANLSNLQKFEADCTTMTGSSVFKNATISSLTELSFPQLTSISGDMAFTGANLSSLTELNFPNLMSISGLSAFSGTNFNSLTTLTFPKLTSISGNFTFYQTTLNKLNELTFPQLTSISGQSTFGFVNLSDLTTLTFPLLTSLSNFGTFQNATLVSLTEFTFPSLLSITGDGTFSESHMNVLPALTFPKLTTLNAGSIFSGVFLPLLKQLYFPVLTSIPKNKTFYMAQLNSLSDLNFSDLSSIAGNETFSQVNLSSLTKLNFPNLLSIAGKNSFDSANVSSLARLNFPQLTSITNDFTFVSANLSSLKNILLPQLTTLTGIGTFFNSRLDQLSSLDFVTKLSSLPDATFYGTIFSTLPGIYLKRITNFTSSSFQDITNGPDDIKKLSFRTPDNLVYAHDAYGLASPPILFLIQKNTSVNLFNYTSFTYFDGTPATNLTLTAVNGFSLPVSIGGINFQGNGTITASSDMYVETVSLRFYSGSKFGVIQVTCIVINFSDWVTPSLVSTQDPYSIHWFAYTSDFPNCLTPAITIQRPAGRSANHISSGILQDLAPSAPGDYGIVVQMCLSDYCLSDRLTLKVRWVAVEAGSDQPIPYGQSVRLGSRESDPDVVYSWDNSDTLDNPSCSYPLATPKDTTTYIVTGIRSDIGRSASDHVTISVFAPITLSDVRVTPSYTCPTSSLATFSWSITTSDPPPALHPHPYSSQ